MTLAYQTQVTAIGGRSGSAASADRRLRIDLSRPGDLGGDNGDGTNPEQLFAAAYAACFLSAIKRAAQQQGIAVAADANVTAKVGLNRDDGVLDVTLSIDLPDVEPGVADRIVEQAHQTCPYSQALRGNAKARIIVI